VHLRECQIVKRFFLHLAFLCMTHSAMSFATAVEIVRHDSAWAHPLDTDRPDVSETSNTVGKLRFQVETSALYSRDRDTALTHDLNFPTLLRYGIAKHFEIRLESEIVGVNKMSGAPATRGVNDLAFGFKTHVCDQRGARPSVALMAHLGVPTGSGEFSAHGVEPIAKALVDWDLPGGFELGTNWGADLPVRDANGHKPTRFLYSAAVWHDVPGTHERLKIFIENAGIVPLTPSQPAALIMNQGVVWLATPNLQFDALVQYALTNAAPNLATGVGVSWRH